MIKIFLNHNTVRLIRISALQQNIRTTMAEISEVERLGRGEREELHVSFCKQLWFSIRFLTTLYKHRNHMKLTLTLPFAAIVPLL